VKRCGLLRFCALALVLGTGSRAAGEENRGWPPGAQIHPLGPGGNCVVVRGGPPQPMLADGFSDLLYLNRCVGDCVVTVPDGWGANAIENTSSICNPETGDTCTLTELGESDESWDALVECVKEVMRPFDVRVITEDPGDVPHHEVMVAGTSAELGFGDSDTLGVSLGPCSALDNALSFAFGNHEALQGDPIYLCHVAVHEPGHSFALHHALPCDDPMTYITGCGYKFFRDREVPCAEWIENEWMELGECWCGGTTQNSHEHLLDVFGEGAAPTPTQVHIENPREADEVGAGFVVHAYATDMRGIDRVELYLNTWKWFEVAGYDYRSRNNPYILRTPADLPDGIVDIEVRAYNDLGIMASSGYVSVLRSEPCTTAEGCLAGQICGEGRCFWPPANVELGGACERVQDCIEGGCREHGGTRLCASFCEPGVEGACGADFDCLTSGTVSFCWPEGGGCCSVDPNRPPPWLEMGLFLGLILLVSRRRARN